MTRSHEHAPEDPYWNEETILCVGTFRYFHHTPRRVWAKLHTSEERYVDANREITTIATPKGMRTYVHMRPSVVAPNIVLTVDIQPTADDDPGDAIGAVRSSQMQGTRDITIGNGQAWYYHPDKTLVLWECFLEQPYRDVPLLEDKNMHALWHGFEIWLRTRFPDSTRIATPFDDPLFETNEYQTFLRSFGYDQVEQAAFGKQL